eukprot:CAMPEP_0115353614 /NCGR_PEP_ID=MMETSP0270-20121206/98134_1 /TAXON_ID=71861 /ORGANISM="Scrippsiella trochoidea, Strain CCMP3099" /LENGTH=227 /DNA_ID=CAMNT_0002775867 /DNA_START=447 /DNA_END=1131 /DNA_ORIENTATION=+
MTAAGALRWGVALAEVGALMAGGPEEVTTVVSTTDMMVSDCPVAARLALPAHLPPLHPLAAIALAAHVLLTPPWPPSVAELAVHRQRPMPTAAAVAEEMRKGPSYGQHCNHSQEQIAPPPGPTIILPAALGRRHGRLHLQWKNTNLADIFPISLGLRRGLNVILAALHKLNHFYLNFPLLFGLERWRRRSAVQATCLQGTFLVVIDCVRAFKIVLDADVHTIFDDSI